MTQDRFEGCLLALALGDALGAPHEGGTLERLVWRFAGKTSEGHVRWTDDTQMSLDLAESILAMGRVDPTDLARRFAASYKWSRGYGPGAAKVLKRIRSGQDFASANRSVYPEGSFGNGAAMRAAVVGLFLAKRRSDIAEAAALSASVTHSHALGIEGAVMIALAIPSVMNARNPLQILTNSTERATLDPFLYRAKIVREWLEKSAEPSPYDVAKQLGNGVAAAQSCVTALYLALRFLERPFMDLHEFVVACGGDVDTIGAMSGAIWGAANGATKLPADEIARLEEHSRISKVAANLFEAASRLATEKMARPKL